MGENPKRFANVATLFGTTMLLGALLMVSGCGSDSSTPAPATTNQSTPIPAASVTQGTVAGTVTTTAPVSAATTNGTTAISIPAGVTIAPQAGTTFSAAKPPSIDVTTFNGVSAMPAPITADVVVDTMSGAIDVKIGGLTSGISFTGGDATITIPITGTDPNCEVYENENEGKGYEYLGQGTCSNGFATIKVHNLCIYVVNPKFKNKFKTGSPGGRGPF